ncbi:MAG TPA: hypothetical protein VEJ18_08435 [Planctomycetota bacterium]|nr:hypothetical protein [Planctomycetota bacterium]
MAKAKQGKLPGMKPDRIVAVEKAATVLRDVRVERMDLTQREVKAQDDLLKVMRENKVHEYRLDNTIFVVARGKDKVSMKTIRDKEEEVVDAEEKKHEEAAAEVAE